MRRLTTAVLILAMLWALQPLRAEEGLEPAIEPGFAKDKLFSTDGIESIDLASGTLSLRIPIGT